jgi:hypothetical protein
MTKKPDKNQLHIAVLTIATIAVYFPILCNDFTYHWDDQWMVMNHFTEGGINVRNLWAILSEFYHGQYSPVCQYYFLFLHELFGYSPAAFHAASLALHTGCVVLTYIIIIRIFGSRTGIREPNARMTAFVTAFIFAVHPMNVESVAWVSAVKAPLYSFFYLSATLAYLTYLKGNRTGYYILTMLLFACSLGSKEQAVIFPVWLALLYLFTGRSLKSKKTWMQLAPFLVMAIAFGVVTLFAQSGDVARLFAGTGTYPLWQRLILGCYSLVEYFIKFIAPYHLLYIYPFPMTVGEPLPEWLLVYPAVLLVVAFSLWGYIKKYPLSAGLSFFLIHIIITLHIISLSRFAVIADRYIYLAGIGIAFIAAYYFVKAFIHRKSFVRKTCIAAFTCLMLGAGVYSNLRCRKWKNTDSIKREMRELLRQRNDYKPKDFKDIENENKPQTYNLIRKERRKPCLRETEGQEKHFNPENFRYRIL